MVDGGRSHQAIRWIDVARTASVGILEITGGADLAEQFRLSKQLYDEWLALNAISDQVRRIRGQLTEMRSRITDATLKAHVDALAEKLQALAGAAGGGFGGGAAQTRATIGSTSLRVRTLFNLIEEVDVAPTPQVASAAPDIAKDSRTLQDTWRTIQSQDLPALNQELRAAGLAAIK